MNIFNLFKKEKTTKIINDNITNDVLQSEELTLNFNRNSETYIFKFHFVNFNGDNRFYIIKNGKEYTNGKNDYMTVGHMIKLRNFLNKLLGE